MHSNNEVHTGPVLRSLVKRGDKALTMMVYEKLSSYLQEIFELFHGRELINDSYLHAVPRGGFYLQVLSEDPVSSSCPHACAFIPVLSRGLFDHFLLATSASVLSDPLSASRSRPSPE